MGAHGWELKIVGFRWNMAGRSIPNIAEPQLQRQIRCLVKGTLQLRAWNKIKTIAAAALVALLLGGSATIAWKVSSEDNNKTASPLAISTFDPMRGEWEGRFELRVNDGLAVRAPATLRAVPAHGRGYVF